MYGGHIPADPNNAAASSNAITAHLYFFMVKNRKTADKDRIIFWFNVCPRHFSIDIEPINELQGGPGCSSFDGAMMEVGPWRWDGKSEHDFWVQPGGWEEYTTMVYGQFSTWQILLPSLMYRQSGSTCRHWFLIYKYRSLCSNYRCRRLTCFARLLITRPNILL